MGCSMSHASHAAPPLLRPRSGQPLSTSYDVSSETLTVESPGSTAVVGGRESTPT